MMGYNELTNQDQLNFLDPFKGANSCKLRPLAPRLNLSPPKHNTCLTSTHPLLSLNNTNHRHFGLSEESNNSKEVVGTNQVMVSSRWNPTPEQLRALEELYRRGTRTPSADQIQHITAQLRRYGKIEGKNVFYWFQNHKARERQKRRRQLQLPPPPPGSSTTGGNRVGFEGEQKSCKWAPSSINKESDPPINQIIAEAETEAATEAKADQTSNTTTTPPHHNNNNNNNRWIHFHHDPPQFQHNHNTNNNNNSNTISSATNLMFAGQRNATWHHHTPTLVQPSCSCCYPLIPFSLSSSKLSNLLPDKPVLNCHGRGNGDGDGDGERPPVCSPTLQLFPVVEMRKEEERENDASLILLQSNCCNVEKASSNGNGNSNSNSNSNSSNNNNNPFPYYQFL